MRIVLITAMLLAVWAPVGSARTWTDSTGKYTVEAEFVDSEDGKVSLKKEDGTVVNLPIQKLSKADQEFIRGELAKRKPKKPEANLIWEARFRVGPLPQYSHVHRILTASANELGIDAQGRLIVQQLADRVNNSKDLAEQKRSLEKMQYLVRALALVAVGKDRQLYKQMLATFGTGNDAEFNRLANIVSAKTLQLNADEYAAKGNDRTRMSVLVGEVSKAASAAEQKKPLAEMQAILDKVVSGGR